MDIDQINKKILAIPFHQFVGIQLVKQEKGRASTMFTASADLMNVVGLLHGGIINSMLDRQKYNIH